MEYIHLFSNILPPSHGVVIIHDLIIT